MAQSFQVDSLSAEVAAMSGPWAMIDALVDGTAAMRAGGKKYLPQFPSEPDAAYQMRLSTSVLFPAFARTTSIMGAKPFARPITFTGTVPADVEALFSDIDRFGTDLQPYMGGVFLHALRYGICGILVDSPPRGRNVRTKADEMRAGIRPYFSFYNSGSILGWRAVQSGEGTNLTQLRLLEIVKESDGNWGQRDVRQVRVLEPGRWEIWRKRQSASGADEWFIFQKGRTSLDRIPFVFFYGLRQSFGIGKSPLIDLAYQNVEHWQSSSDQQNITRFARVPIVFAKGFAETDQLVIGTGTAARSSNKDADLQIVEHTGAAIEAGRQSILDLEDRMRQTGAELLVQRPSITTATQVTSDNEGNRSTLQQIAEDFEESIEQTVNLLGLWMRQPFEAEVELYKDFGSANLSEKSGDLLLRAAKDGHVSSETTFNQLKRMDVVGPDLSWEDEDLRLTKQRAARVKELAAVAASQPPAE